MALRDIGDILHFRSDISPFLVHLTRLKDEISARTRLITIIDSKRLTCSLEKISDARWGIDVSDVDRCTSKGFFSAICFTETPLNEIHCLLEIRERQVDLEPYGLVFLKDNLIKRGISPVLYINNKMGDKSSIFAALASLVYTHPEEALDILPLIAVYGEQVQGVGATTPQAGRNEFMWEREWRYPHVKGDLNFDENDIFVGLCPHENIEEFESYWHEIPFVDPTRNMKWYARKLIDSRQRLDIKDSVV